MSAAPDPLTIILLASVFLVMAEILRALSAGALLAPAHPRRRLEFDGAVFGIALFFILLSVVPALLQPFLAAAKGPVAEAVAEKPVPTSRQVLVAILTNFFVIGIVISSIIARRKNQLTDYGIDLRGWLAEVRFGGLGYLACLPFVIALLLLISRWRSPETQNPLLIVLRETGSKQTIWEVVFAAVVSAPLAEELLFRVALQGSLESRLSPAWAIGITAVVFVSMHGRYDALPLLPLAIALGCLYHFRRSYVAIVTAHALFNATFLILALSRRG